MTERPETTLETPPESPVERDRREFLKKCGRFAAITPPALTILLSTSLTSDAIAKSGGRGHGHGRRHGWHHWHRWHDRHPGKPHKP
jgi:hypothetical protein